MWKLDTSPARAPLQSSAGSQPVDIYHTHHPFPLSVPGLLLAFDFCPCFFHLLPAPLSDVTMDVASKASGSMVKASVVPRDQDVEAGPGTGKGPSAKQCRLTAT